jgi:hypothetical protein
MRQQIEHDVEAEFETAFTFFTRETVHAVPEWVS